MTVTSTTLIHKLKMSPPSRTGPSRPARRSSPHPAPESYPTLSATATSSEHSAGSVRADKPQTAVDDYYRALDRELASRYLRLVMKRGGQQQVQVMKPRMQIYSPPQSTHTTALFELPGLKNSDINVNVTRDGKLTVSGERHPPSLWDNADQRAAYFPVQEFKYGKFERSLNIPPGVESRHITASLNEGILSLSWPRVAPSDARANPNSPPVTSVQALIH